MLRGHEGDVYSAAMELLSVSEATARANQEDCERRVEWAGAAPARIR